MYIKYFKIVVERKGKKTSAINIANRFLQSIPEPYIKENAAKQMTDTAYMTKII